MAIFSIFHDVTKQQYNTKFGVSKHRRSSILGKNGTEGLMEGLTIGLTLAEKAMAFFGFYNFGIC